MGWSLWLARSRREQLRIERLERRIDSLQELIDGLIAAGGVVQFGKVAKLVRKQRAAMAEWNRLTWDRRMYDAQ